MNEQLTIFDSEYDVLNRVLGILTAVKTANTTAYRDNIYWRMGFEAAERVIIHELERGGRTDETETDQGSDQEA